MMLGQKENDKKDDKKRIKNSLNALTKSLQMTKTL